MYFTNLQDSRVQAEIKQLCRGHCGVYKITNLINKNSYVGSAITKKPSLNRLYIRFRNHFFNHHKPFPISRAIKKYGVQNFSWEIIEFTEISTTRARETHWIQTLKPDYNILQSGETSLGFTHTPETRIKMKAGYSRCQNLKNWSFSNFGTERRVRIGNVNKWYGKEFREKLSQIALARTSEQKQRHQQACASFNQLIFSKPTQILDADTLKVLGTFQSLREACRAWQGNYRTFKRVVKSGEKIHKFNIFVKYVS